MKKLIVLLVSILLPVQFACPSFSLAQSVSTPTVDLFSGGVNYSIPIDVPPGRNGMQPNLKLTYNSHRGNGWVGVGWGLSVGAIQRSTKHGVDYAGDDFLFNGQKLVAIVPGQEYQAKIEGEFNRILKLTASDGRTYWEVTDKVGTKYLYGQTAESRQDDPGNADRIFKWCLDKVIDTNSNYMVYSYSKDQGQIYLDQILYSGNENEGLSPSNLIKFHIENRSDSPEMFRTLFSATLGLRLEAISVYANSIAQPSYQLIYDADLESSALEYSQSTGRSLLGSVKKVSADGRFEQETVLKYQVGGNRLNDEGVWTNAYANWDESASRVRPMDVNGDGLQDIVIGPDSSGDWYVLEATGNGFIDRGSWVKAYGNWHKYASRIRSMDVNGDGLQDIVIGPDSSGNWYVLESTGSSFIDRGSWVNAYGNWYKSTNRIRPMDVNGDGMQDIVIGPDSSGHWYVLESTGTGFLDKGPWITAYGNFSSNPDRIRPMDVNGDGLQDIVVGPAGNGDWYVLESTGTGFLDKGPWVTAYGNFSGNSNRIRTMDVNGDGLQDIVVGPAVNGDWYVLESTGTGFLDKGPWITAYGNFSSNPDRIRPMDVNGDGLQDIVVGPAGNGDWYVLESTGTGFLDKGPWITAYGNFSGNSNRIYPMDANGDGLQDILLGPSGNGDWFLLKSNGETSDLLSLVRNQIGKTSSVKYTSSSLSDKNQLPFSVQTVNRITTDDGNDVVSATDYEFSGGFYHVKEREFRGFNYAKVTGPESASGKRQITETWFHQGDKVGFDENNPYAKEGFMAGRAYHKIVSDKDGNKLSEVQTIYKDDANGIAPYFTPESQIKSFLCENGDCGLETSTQLMFDEYGNLRLEYNQGDISTDSDNYVDIRHYAYNESAHILALPESETIYNFNGELKSLVKYFYDGPSDCSTPATSQIPETGQVSRIVHWLDNKTDGTPADVEERMGYDTYGNLRCSVDGRGNKTQKNYDETHTFVLTETDPLGNTSTFSYYGVDGVAADIGLYGQIKSVSDPNGATVTTEYDTFGRKTFESGSDGTFQISVYLEFGTVGNQYVYSINNLGFATKEYFDGLGRTFKKISLARDSLNAIEMTEYDARGNVVRSSLPFFEGEDSYYAEMDYDTSGRPLTMTNPDNTAVQYCYDDNVVVSIDANKHARRETKDAFGRLVKVEEYQGEYTACSTDLGTPYAATIYEYDVLGNLIAVTDAQNNKTTISYDSLGRKIGMIDPDMGAWSYDYDANNNLVYQQDANGQVIRFEYDALDRLSIKNYASSAETDVHYYYDESGHGYSKGRPTRMVDASGTTSYRYNDSSGHSVTTTQTLGGHSYDLTMSTDALGRTVSVQYPDGKVAGYVYQARGQLKDVIYDGEVLCSYSDYNAAGQIGQITYANGISTKYTYEAETARLWTLDVARSGTQLLSNEYLYYDNGFVKDIFNYTNSPKTQIFEYDELGRLTHAQSQVYGDLHYDYDSIGNIKIKDGRTYTPNEQHPHAVAEISGGRTFSYDNVGNMLSDGLRSYAWNADNMPTSITMGGATTSFVYDGLGRRVKKSGPSGTTLYIGDLYEISGGIPVSYVFANGQRLAMIRSAAAPLDKLYYHQDHLGSTGLVTDSSGNVVEQIFYKPFGGTVADTGSLSLNHKYTGQEQDQETGLYNYNARLYDPEVGKFISSDSFAPSVVLPQTFNRYSYCGNNPVVYTDPSGYSWWGKHIAHNFGKIDHVIQDAIGWLDEVLNTEDWPDGDYEVGVGMSSSGEGGQLEFRTSNPYFKEEYVRRFPNLYNAIYNHLLESSIRRSSEPGGNTIFDEHIDHVRFFILENFWPEYNPNIQLGIIVPMGGGLGAKPLVREQVGALVREQVESLKFGKITRFAGKTSARQAFSGEMRAAANRFFRGATTKSTDFKALDIANGGKRLEYFSRARNAGYGKRYVQEIDNTGRIIREFKETIGPSGIRDIKWIHGGPE